MKKIPESSKQKNIVLVGNPNVGKSVIFAALTGRYVTVSNYPGTTVEVTTGKAKFDHKKALVIDTPGINTLIPTSEDEKVTRDILLKQKNACIVQVADAKNLRRALLITLQLIEMGFPLVLNLNMMDEAKSRGIKINTHKLSERLEIDVVPTVAVQKRGIEALIKSLKNPKKSSFKFHYDENIEKAVAEILPYLPSTRISKRALALMVLAGDKSLIELLEKTTPTENIKKIEKTVHNLKRQYGEPLNYVLNRERLFWVSTLLKEVLEEEKIKLSRAGELLSKITVHPIWGIPLLLIVVFLTYEIVGVLGAQITVNFFEKVIFGKYINPYAIKIVNFLIPFKILREFLVGNYGIITMAFTYGFAIILPIVTFFFLVFGVLEDSGYLPRLAVMVDKIFKVMGLSGKAVLPMILGLGCDTMATMTARILETRKEKILTTLLLALGIPCSAQLGVILGMASSVSIFALLIWAAVVILILFMVGYLASKVIPGRRSDFIIELPPLRIPKLSNILVKTLARLEWYIKEVVPLFVLGTAILFFFDKLKILFFLRKIASPVVVGFLNLPSKATDAFLIGFLRRDYGAAGLFALAKAGELNGVQIVVSLVTITLFVPCIANFLVIIKERGLKTALYIVGFIFPFAFLVGGALNFILRFLGVSL